MNVGKSLRSLGCALIGAMMFAALPTLAQGTAQQITGTPGSPSATTTTSGKQLPPPDPKFGGVIKDGALQSKYWWPPRVVPPKRAAPAQGARARRAAQGSAG